MGIKVINPGLQTTVQDSGRQLSGHVGVSSCGAADKHSLKLANLIVQNMPTEAALEMTLLGGTYKFEESADICLSGSCFLAMINNETLPFNKKIHIKKGEIIKIGETRDGARCYLAVRGGIHINHFFGSASTHLTTRTGGLNGRPLKKGDLFKFTDLLVKLLTKKNFFRPKEKRKSMVRNLYNLFYKLKLNGKELRILASIVSALSKKNFKV